jgi:release factor glutamine methyltransferase
MTPAAVEAYAALLARAARQEPIPYLTGQAPFRDLRLRVSPAVLIPRPETEELVAHALRWARGRQGLRIVDVGVGSGCIAVSLALALPEARVAAVDISAEALALARANAQTYGAAIDFYHGSLLEPIADPLDLIVANLPYVAAPEWTHLADGIKWYEPASALLAGPDGLLWLRGLLAQAPSRLRPRGAIFLEIGWQQGPAVLALAQHYLPHAVCACHRDLAGHERIISIEQGEV